MERALIDAGYRLQSASNGLRALELARQWSVPPDVLVTDVRMEGLDGIELAGLITAKHPHVQVLLVSGYDPEHSDRAWPLLPKPFAIQDLVQVVGRLVTARATAARTKVTV